MSPKFQETADRALVRTPCLTGKQLALLEQASRSLQKLDGPKAALKAKQEKRASWMLLQMHLNNVAAFVATERTVEWIDNLPEEDQASLRTEKSLDWEALNPLFCRQFIYKWVELADILIGQDKLSWLESSKPVGPCAKLTHELFLKLVKEHARGERSTDAVQGSLELVRLKLGESRFFVGGYFAALAATIKPGPNPYSVHFAKNAEACSDLKSDSDMNMNRRYRLASMSLDEAATENPSLVAKLDVHGYKGSAKKGLYAWVREYGSIYAQFGEVVPEYDTWRTYIDVVLSTGSNKDARKYYLVESQGSVVQAKDI